jgi:hypothetical protein
VTWGIDLADGGAALAIAILLNHDQPVLYPAGTCGARGYTTDASNGSSTPPRCSASEGARNPAGSTTASEPRASATPRPSSPWPAAASTSSGHFCGTDAVISPLLPHAVKPEGAAALEFYQPISTGSAANVSITSGKWEARSLP